MTKRAAHWRVLTAGIASVLLTTGLAATGVASASAAQARPTCQDAGVKTICETKGSVSIKSRPGTKAPPGNSIPWNRGVRGAGGGR